jgi:dephospho-CoA kinase
MKVLGLTGGIGMGKSTAAAALRQRGLPVVDTDQLARQVVEPGQPALAEIRTAFGPGIIGADGRLRREEIARVIFSDATARRTIERILHPRIRELWRGQLAAWRGEHRPVAAVVIPLLFEVQAETECHATICVACSAASQRERLQARGWTPEQIEQRSRAQWPVEQKMLHADFVVWTEGDVAVATEQLDRILAGL